MLWSIVFYSLTRQQLLGDPYQVCSMLQMLFAIGRYITPGTKTLPPILYTA